MSRATWDQVWLDVAVTIAQRSLCTRDQVGAVIVSATNRIVDTGYNGPPAGFPWTADSPCSGWCERATMNIQSVKGREYYDDIFASSYDNCPALHAEANALMFSDRDKRVGGTIYVSSGTCGNCAKLVANSGLARAVYVKRHEGRRASDKWYDFLRQCGVEVEVVNHLGRVAVP